MKTYLRRFLLISLSIFIIAACTPQRPQYPTRADDLADVGLLGRHAIKGVNIENGYQGNFDGGFFLFGGGVTGQISPATNYLVEWYITDGVSIPTSIPRSKIVVNTVVYTTEHPGPEIEFIFYQEWVDKELDGSIYSQPFTADQRINPNSILESGYYSGSPINIVNVYISAEDQAGLATDQCD